MNLNSVINFYIVQVSKLTHVYFLTENGTYQKDVKEVLVHTLEVRGREQPVNECKCCEKVKS